MILAKPDRNRRELEEFPTLQQAHTKSPPLVENPDRSESPAPAATKVLLGRKDPVVNSPVQETKPVDPDPEAVGDFKPFKDRSVRLIDDQQQFCSSGLGPVMTDNTEFLVVGVIGLQNVGKSMVLNRLANHFKRNGENTEEMVQIFREQSFEKQMLGEHCTNGIKAWVAPTTRTIFLDSQPLNSVSMLDRAMQLIDKKHNAEFSTLETTIEMQSLQVVGYLMTICHVVVLVQDNFVDMDLMEFIQTAEMLKPSSPALIGSSNSDSESSQMVEYFPEFVIVQNKSKIDDFGTQKLEEFQEFYKKIFAKSQLKFNTGKVAIDSSNEWSNSSKLKWKMGDVNMCVLPEFEGKTKSGYERHIAFEDCVAALRRKVLSVPPVHLTTSKLTERMWLKFAEKSWDNIKGCPFYTEYSRLLTV